MRLSERAFVCEQIILIRIVLLRWFAARSDKNDSRSCNLNPRRVRARMRCRWRRRAFRFVSPSRSNARKSLYERRVTTRIHGLSSILLRGGLPSAIIGPRGIRNISRSPAFSFRPRGRARRIRACGRTHARALFDAAFPRVMRGPFRIFSASTCATMFHQRADADADIFTFSKRSWKIWGATWEQMEHREMKNVEEITFIFVSSSRFLFLFLASPECNVTIISFVLVSRLSHVYELTCHFDYYSRHLTRRGKSVPLLSRAAFTSDGWARVMHLKILAALNRCVSMISDNYRELIF